MNSYTDMSLSFLESTTDTLLEPCDIEAAEQFLSHAETEADSPRRAKALKRRIGLGFRYFKIVELIEGSCGKPPREFASEGEDLGVYQSVFYKSARWGGLSVSIQMDLYGSTLRRGRISGRFGRDEVRRVEGLLNGRPRKVLEYRTPEEVFKEALAPSGGDLEEQGERGRRRSPGAKSGMALAFGRATPSLRQAPSRCLDNPVLGNIIFSLNGEHHLLLKVLHFRVDKRKSKKRGKYLFVS